MVGGPQSLVDAHPAELPDMTITRIRLANFKNFADQTVELNDFNLLVGANASGKSNFCPGVQVPARHRCARTGGRHLFASVELSICQFKKGKPP